MSNTASNVQFFNLGTQLTEDMLSTDVIKAAGLDWSVEVAPIVTNDQKRTGIDDYRVTRRVEDSLILGVVKRSYQPIQNVDAFKMFDNVVKDGRILYHNAGYFRGGSKIFVTAKLPGVIEIGKGVGKTDEVERYLLLSNSHDGSRPLTMLFTPVRVVCENTLSLALSPRSADEVTKTAPRVAVKHTALAARAMREAERVMSQAVRYYERFGDWAEFLYERQLNTAQVEGIIQEVFPPNKKKEVTPKVKLHRENVERLFDEGKGHSAIAGSAWALLNSFAEYADHGLARMKSDESSDQNYSILMGGMKNLKQFASKVIFEAVSA